MDLKNVRDESVDCMVSFIPDNLDIDILKECVRVLKHGTFAFFVSNARQDIEYKSILKMEDAGFAIKFSKIAWVYKGEGEYPKTKIVLVGMKPLSEKSYTAQAIKTGKGVTWLDDCRIPLEGNDYIPSGRFPGNMITSDDVVNKDNKTGRSKEYGDVPSASAHLSLDRWYKAKFKTDNETRENKLRAYLRTLGSREGDIVIDPFDDKFNDPEDIKKIMGA